MRCGQMNRSASMALMMVSCLSTESRFASADRRWRRTVANRVESATACSSRAVRSAAVLVCVRCIMPTVPVATMRLAIAASRNGSLNDDCPSPTTPFSEKLAPRPLDFRDAPGERLISIIVRLGGGSGSLAEGKADGKHQQRGDLVGHQTVEGTVADANVGQRVRQLDRQAQTAAECFGQARHAGTATTQVDRLQLRTGSRRRRQEGGRALHTDGDLLTTTLDHRVQVRRPVVTLKQPLGLIGAEPTLTLQILAETARAHRDVTSENRDAVV